MKEKDLEIIEKPTGEIDLVTHGHRRGQGGSYHNSAQDTIYLCNFRVSVDGDWLCLRQLDDVEVPLDKPTFESLPSPEFMPYYDRDPCAVERNNLLNITKLVIKELIEWSMRHGRSLDSDHPPLQHFFIVLEHAMRHGLKPKKGLLGPKKELWDVLQLVEKCTNEAQDITSSVKDLPTVSTHLGRARSWLRLALMQKKLADYFRVLVDKRDNILMEFYEPFALMMCDEAPVLSGLLVGLNVIDCNFCLKEEDLDSTQGVIDFSLYLRSTRSSVSADDEGEPTNMDNVLDQKNYIEELNRHLNATVTNLQTRVETLTTTNALLSEDLLISKNTILSLQEETRQTKLRLDQFTSATSPIQDGASKEFSGKKSHESRNSPHSSDTEAEVAAKLIKEEHNLSIASAGLLGTSPSSANLSVTDLSKKLHDERALRAEIEKELEFNKSQKSEMETAMLSMEKDVHEKQDTVITLRKQLEDIKQINLEMYRKLQECEEELHDKGRLIDRLQVKTTQIATLLQNLEAAKTFELPSPAGSASSRGPLFLLGTSRSPSVEFQGQGPPGQQGPPFYRNPNPNQFGQRPPDQLRFKSQRQNPIPSFQALQHQKLLKQQQDVPPEYELTVKSLKEDMECPIESDPECEKSITFKTELNSKLEAKVTMLDETISKLEEKLSAGGVDMKDAQLTMRSLGQQIADKELKMSTLEGDLRVEREWRQSLQDNNVKDKEKISELLMEMQKWRLQKVELDQAMKEIENLRKLSREQEITLEEMGVKVAESKLLADEFREANSSASSTWKSDKDFRNCKLCEKEFSLTRRKHHCRNCGYIFCNSCSDNSMELPSSAKPVRVCDTCYTFFLQRYSTNRTASIDQ